MSSPFQTIAALAIVAIAAGWMIRNLVAKRRNPGCGGGCGCPADKFKANLKH